MHPRVFVISGPSGVGKSTIIRKTLETFPHSRLSVSYTTREKREGEIDGKDYHFIGKDEFQRMITAEEFMEWAQVFDNYYGTGNAHVQGFLDQGQHALLDVDTQGAMNIKSVSSGAVFVFIKPPSLAHLEQRLRARGSETDASMFNRLSHAEHELSFAGEYDHEIINDTVENACAAMQRIVSEEEQQTHSFICPIKPEPAPGALQGDDAFLEHLNTELKERIILHFSDRMRDSLRTELIDLINARLHHILDRDLERLIKETLATMEMPRP